MRILSLVVVGQLGQVDDVRPGVFIEITERVGVALGQFALFRAPSSTLVSTHGGLELVKLPSKIQTSLREWLEDVFCISQCCFFRCFHTLTAASRWFFSPLVSQMFVA